jgi:hypothetical protein
MSLSQNGRHPLALLPVVVPWSRAQDQRSTNVLQLFKTDLIRMQVTVLTLTLTSPTLPPDRVISLDVTNPASQNLIIIKEGVEYSYVALLTQDITTYG